MNKTYHAQVHRFRNKVCAFLGTGDSVYMTALEAKKLARMLNDAANDVTSRSFTDSQFQCALLTINSAP